LTLLTPKKISIRLHLHTIFLSHFFGCNCRQASSKAQAILCEHTKNVIFHITRKQRATLSWHIIITEWQHFFLLLFLFHIFFACCCCSFLLVIVVRVYMDVHGGWKIYVYTFYYSMWNDKCLLPHVLHELIKFFENESELFKGFLCKAISINFKSGFFKIKLIN